MASSTWTHVVTPEPMSIAEAVQEVFKVITPPPVSIEATLTTLCSATNLRALTTRHEYMTFLHLVQAAVHNACPTPTLLGEVRDALGMFCHRRGLKLDGIG